MGLALFPGRTQPFSGAGHTTHVLRAFDRVCEVVSRGWLIVFQCRFTCGLASSWSFVPVELCESRSEMRGSFLVGIVAGPSCKMQRV